VTLEFTLSNLGGGQITGIGFTDSLVGALPGLSNASGTLNDVCGIGSSIGGTTLLTFSGGALDPGTSCTFSVTVAVDIGVANGSVATNTVSDAQGVLGGQTVFADEATADLVIADPRDVPLTIESVVVAPEPSFEGQTVAASATFTGGAGGTLCTVDYGDGSGPVAGSIAGSVCTGPVHVYGDNGIFTVAVTVTETTETDSETASHTVINVAPTVSAPVTTPEPSGEGSAVTASALFGDPGFNDAPFTCTVDYGDGAGSAPGTIDNGSCVGPSYTYGDNGSFTVTVTVTDKDGGVGSNTLIHTVDNVPPIVSAPVVTPEPSDEGSAVTASADFTDPGFDDSPFTCTVDYGDGVGAVVGTVTGLTCTGPSHTYGDNGSYAVTVAVTDKDGGEGSAIAFHQVDNLDPTVTLDTTGVVAFPGGDAFIGRQGVPQEHQADGEDPGSDDLEFRWDFSGQIVSTTYYNDTGDPSGSPDGLPSSDGTYPFSVSDTASVTFMDPGAFQVSIELTDDDGGFDSQALAKLVSGDEVCVRTQGFWRHQFKAKNPHFDADTLQAFLDYVNLASSVFSETVDAYDATTAGEVFESGGGKREKANSQTLAAWLNIASGAVSVDDLVEFDDGTNDTVLNVLAAVEAILNDPGASDAELVTAADLAKAITYLVNGACGATTVGALLNYGIEVEFATGCWATYIPSPDDCIDCEGKASGPDVELVGRGGLSGDLLVPASTKGGGESCSAFGGTSLKILDSKLEWRIANTGSETITIDSISIYWPRDFGDLRRITLRNVTIFDHVIGPSATTVDSGWRGHEVDRQIEPGAIKKLKLEFGDARASETRDRLPE
jgi:PKD repeat protein